MLSLENDQPQRPLIHFNIEAKFARKLKKREVQNHARLLAELAEKKGISHRIIAQSFNLHFISEMKKLNPHIRTSALFSPTYWDVFLLVAGGGRKVKSAILHTAINHQADIISPHQLYIDEEFIRLCHAHNLQVYAWTVNSQKEILSLLSAGIDGIISDYPDVLFNTYSGWQKVQRH